MCQGFWYRMSVSFNALEILAKAVYGLVPLWFALSFHEYAHGWMAKKRGDRTAEQMGRLTMNPIAHLDLVGTVILPLVAIITQFPMIGWAKPVPVNPSFLRNPRIDMFWVAFAGPLSNVLLAFVGVFLYGFIKNVHLGLTFQTQGLVLGFLDYFILINFFLFAINMIPVHPLDGAKVFERFLPQRANLFILNNQGTIQIVLLIMVFTGYFYYILFPFIWFQKTLLSFL